MGILVIFCNFWPLILIRGEKLSLSMFNGLLIIKYIYSIKSIESQKMYSAFNKVGRIILTKSNTYEALQTLLEHPHPHHQFQ